MPLYLGMFSYLWKYELPSFTLRKYGLLNTCFMTLSNVFIYFSVQDFYRFSPLRCSNIICNSDKHRRLLPFVLYIFFSGLNGCLSSVKTIQQNQVSALSCCCRKAIFPLGALRVIYCSKCSQQLGQQYRDQFYSLNFCGGNLE